jgi:PhnB protein
MKLNAYLSFDGTCEAAFEHYKSVLGGEVTSRMYWREAPQSEEFKLPAGWEDKVMHSHLQVGDATLLGADSPPGSWRAPAGIAVLISAPTTVEADRIFDGLANGGSITMPIGQTFFAERFGMLVDRFGTPWMVISDPDS